jgi:hypothetical protein
MPRFTRLLYTENSSKGDYSWKQRLISHYFPRHELDSVPQVKNSSPTQQTKISWIQQRMETPYDKIAKQ